LRPFAVLVRLTRNRLTFNDLHVFLHSHAENLTLIAKTAKTYGRLFGMIFLGASAPTLTTALQWLPTIKIQKNAKNAK
jgi:hypothetical protein